MIKPVIINPTAAFSAAQGMWRKTVDAFYRATRPGRFALKINGSPHGESADHDYAAQRDYLKLVTLGRQFDRDDVIASAVVDRLVDNVIQCGFGYHPKTGVPEFDDLLKLKVSSIAETESIDLSGRATLHQLARLSFRDAIVAGDSFHLLLNTGKVQTFENHRCLTPLGLPGEVSKMTIHGVQLDGFRRRKAYWFAKDDIALNEQVDIRNAVPIDAFDSSGYPNVLHIYHPKRITQTRGVTCFAPVCDVVPMHNDIQFAKMVQQQQVSNWVLVRQRPLGFEYPDQIAEPIYQEPDPCTPGQVRNIQDSSPGMVYTGYNGESVSAFHANVPNPTFFDHAQQMQQLISINLGVPLILCLLDASQTNFSGWRGALEQAKMHFIELQKWFALAFYRPILLWQLRLWSDPASAQADPAIVAMRASGADIFAHEWTLPTWPYIQPIEDATADVIKLRSGMTSPRRAHLARSQDYSAIVKEIVDDRKQLIVAAKLAAAEINAQFPDDKSPAHWRDLAPLPTSEGETLALPSVEPERMNQGGKNNAPQK